MVCMFHILLYIMHGGLALVAVSTWSQPPQSLALVSASEGSVLLMAWSRFRWSQLQHRVFCLAYVDRTPLFWLGESHTSVFGKPRLCWSVLGGKFSVEIQWDSFFPRNYRVTSLKSVLWLFWKLFSGAVALLSLCLTQKWQRIFVSCCFLIPLQLYPESISAA